MTTSLRVVQPNTSDKLFERVTSASWEGKEKVPHLIEDVMRNQWFALIFGQPAHGKTFVSLDLAGRVSLGQPWWGHKTRRCNVLYVCAEDEDGVQERWDTWRDQNNFNSETPEVSFIFDAVQVQNTAHLDYLIDEVREGDIGLVIFDTLNATFMGDENSGEALTSYCQAIRRLIRDTGCSVVVVHHTGWADISRPRGARQLEASADTCIISKMGKKETITVENGNKCRMKKFKPISLKLHDLGNDKALLIEVETSEVSSTKDDLAKKKGAVIIILEDAGEQGITYTALHTSAKALLEQEHPGVNLSYSSFNKIVKGDNTICKHEKHYYHYAHCPHCHMMDFAELDDEVYADDDPHAEDDDIECPF